MSIHISVGHYSVETSGAGSLLFINAAKNTAAILFATPHIFHYLLICYYNAMRDRLC